MPFHVPLASGRGRPIRSAFLAAALALAAALSAPATAFAEDQNWVGTWMASPQPTWDADFPFPTKIPASVTDQTFRQVVRVSLGGSRVRLVFSNAYGDQPMRIGGASVGLAGESGAAEPGTIHTLTFGGKDEIVVPPGAPAISDPLDMSVEAQAKLAISIYLPDETPLTTFHWDGRQTAWFGEGDQTEADSFAATETTDARVFLSDVLIDTPNEGAVVVIGDSITDGNGATVDADARWPDFLAARLAPRRIAVLNGGISGGRLRQDKMGVNVAARLERDVFAQPNVKAAILLIGINDISWPGTDFAPDQTRPTADEMIAGYQVIELARANDVRLIGATLPPFEGALTGTPLGNYYHPDKDALRQEVNRWIRESGAFDAIVDFDAELRDPANPARMNPAFDSGDHLHPGDAGTRREDVVIATKAFFPMSDNPNDRGLSRRHILASVDASLERLGTDYIDLFVIHRFDPDTPIEETAEALDAVVRAGKVRYLGTSSMHAWQFMKLLAFQRHNRLAAFISMQSQYNLITREDEEEMIPLCQEEGIGLTPWSPLGRGILAGSRKSSTVRADTDEQVVQWYEGRDEVGETVATVEAVANAKGVSPAQIALAWVLAQPGVSSPIVGMSKPHHLHDAMGALSLTLTAEEIATLEAPMLRSRRAPRW